jgi:hypothetical protein
MNRKILAILAAVALVFGLAACSNDSESEARTQAQAAKADPNRKTLEKANLAERIKRQEQATKIGYVYLLNFGKPFGYYVIKGKVSSSGSQLTPEDDVIRSCGGGSCDWQVVDGAQDDGTFGTGDPGIFFFTTAGTMVETSIDYIYTDQPMDIDVPELGK